MYDEDDLLPLSGLQHLQFCERQWALIHVERQWEENRLTAEGRVLHERVHEAASEARSGIVVARGLALRSLRFGVSGQADVVEFHSLGDGVMGGVALDERPGRWRPFPVEYKRGKPKSDGSDEVQLCAQALCLEEMFGARIESGALFYGTTRRRKEVAFDERLRNRTERLARRMHELFENGITPVAVYSKKCENCSLMERCGPKATRSASRYLAAALVDAPALFDAAALDDKDGLDA